MTMTNVHYQDQGFCGTAKQSANDALKQANRELNAAVNDTPEDKRPEYHSQIRWEGDGYAWYWLLRE